MTPSLVSFALEQPEMLSSHDYKDSNVRQNFSLYPLYILYFNMFFLIKNSCPNLIFHLPCLILISIDYVFLWTERILLLIIPSYFLFNYLFQILIILRLTPFYLSLLQEIEISLSLSPLLMRVLFSFCIGISLK